MVRIHDTRVFLNRVCLRGLHVRFTAHAKPALATAVHYSYSRRELQIALPSLLDCCIARLDQFGCSRTLLLRINLYSLPLLLRRNPQCPSPGLSPPVQTVDFSELTPKEVQVFKSHDVVNRMPNLEKLARAAATGVLSPDREDVSAPPTARQRPKSGAANRVVPQEAVIA